MAELWAARWLAPRLFAPDTMTAEQGARVRARDTGAQKRMCERETFVVTPRGHVARGCDGHELGPNARSSGPPRQLQTPNVAHMGCWDNQ